MTARVITGSKAEIARQLADLKGDVREAIVFIDEPTSPQPVPATVEEMFREMEPYTAHAGEVDDSRSGIYSHKPGE